MRHELRQIREHSFFDKVGDSPILVDLGANVGRFAKEFLELYPGARAILVEGDPYLTDILQQTFARSNQVQLFKGLIGASSKQNASFHLCKVPEGNSVFSGFSESWSPGESREIQVEMISLGSLLKLADCQHVDLLKVDIEGSEWDVLATVTEQQAQMIEQISVEFHDFIDTRFRPRTEGAIEHLRSLGYEVLSRGTDRQQGSPYFDCLFYR